jgi:hypothetical protein
VTTATPRSSGRRFGPSLSRRRANGFRFPLLRIPCQNNFRYLAGRFFAITLTAFGFLIIPAFQIAEAATWTQIDQSLNRCSNSLDRARRMLSTYEAETERLRRVGVKSERENHDYKNRLLDAASTRAEYLRNRIERIENLYTRLERDIETKRRESGSCPSCISSSVDLFCRQSKTLLDELRGQTSIIREHQKKLERKTLSEKSDTAKIEFPLDSLLELVASKADSTQNPRASTLLQKAYEHYNLSNKFHAEKKSEKAGKEAAIARRFAKRALEIASGPVSTNRDTTHANEEN